MQRTWANSASPTGERVLEDAGDAGWHRYTLQKLGSITIRRCTGANEIHLTRHGTKPHIYGLGDRGQTDRCRAVLRKLYPDLVREELADAASCAFPLPRSGWPRLTQGWTVRMTSMSWRPPAGVHPRLVFQKL